MLLCLSMIEGMVRREQREHILDAARRLLATAPNERDVSMERVADAARLSRATVYRYFPSKAALVAAAAANGAPRVADSRTKILEAALAVFGERGIHAATLQEIAARAGLSLSGLHWHFKNKDELVTALADRSVLLPTVAREVAAAPDADLETQLTHVAAAALQGLGRYRGLLRALLCEADVYPDVARLVATKTAGRGLPLLAELFEQHARRGTLRPGPARVRAQAFISMLAVLVLIRPALGELIPEDDQACTREYVQIMLRGVLAEPGGQANERRDANSA